MLASSRMGCRPPVSYCHMLESLYSLGRMRLAVWIQLGPLSSYQHCIKCRKSKKHIHVCSVPKFVTLAYLRIGFSFHRWTSWEGITYSSTNSVSCLENCDLEAVFEQYLSTSQPRYSRAHNANVEFLRSHLSRHGF